MKWRHRSGTLPFQCVVTLAALAWSGADSFGASTDRTALPGMRPQIVAELAPTGRPPATQQLSLALGLPLRNPSALEELLVQLYDPASTNFHRFLTQPEFTGQFGPTEADYEAAIGFAEQNGLVVVHRHANRLVLDVSGSVGDIERAFQVTLRTYRHPKENRDFFAPDTEPSVPAGVPVRDLWGLSDYARPQPLAHRRAAVQATPLNYNGTGPSGSYQGQDFRNAYAFGTGLTGAGQVAAVAEFDGYYANDIATYLANCGYSDVPLQNVLLNKVSGTPGYSGLSGAVAEVSLDIELLIAMAPGLTKVMVYEGSNPYSVFSQIASDNSAKQISCSWSWSRGPSYSWAHGPGNYTLDAVLSQMVAQGQNFFQASGDSDAYTGLQALSSSSGPIPIDSIYATIVGGTSLTMSGGGTSWASETVWNWGNNTGSGGGVSPNYTIPWWQTNASMAANGGSTTQRNIPDVAMTADAVQVIYNNGASGIFGGTSCAAPLWAGFAALVNQQATATGGGPVGFLNPALYQLAAGSNYSACFHDTTSGNNIGTNTPGLYYAGPNYDLATGLGTPNGANLINALAPPTVPYFVTQPASQTATNGATVALSAAAAGQAPLAYQWRFNDTNLPPGANLTGTTSNTLTLTSVTAASAGNYTLVVTNSYGAATSSVASLTVTFPPSFTAQPSSQSVVAGNNAALTATVSGATPLAYQWRQNGTNLLNGGTISGATSNVLSLVPVTTNSAGSYTLLVTNLYGRATSSVATLTVLVPAAIIALTAPPAVQCGSNANFSVTASGTPPLYYQWSLDGTPIAGATASSLTLTDLHLPGPTVAVMVTNLYGGANSSAPVTVQDTLPPIITLNGPNPLYTELGAAYTEPGAAAYDLCAGSVPVNSSGTVETNAAGTNTLTYTATDTSGNTIQATRTVVVRDTTPPVISGSFTNLVLGADAACTALMPDVTGTNFIQAADLSGALFVTQDPTNNALLTLGTNIVVIRVADASGNAAYSTNEVLVQDQAAPLIVSQPQDQAGSSGGTASFSVAATACTSVSFQWWFEGAPIPDETNSVLSLSNLTASAAGNYSVIIWASGGQATSTVAVLTMDLVPSLALASSENPSGYKDALSFTATMSPLTTSGAIEFLTNGTRCDIGTLVDGVVTSTVVSSLPRGTNLVTARYSGDRTFLPAESSFEQVVTNHPPMVSPAFYNVVAGTDLLIPVASLATNWSDTDGDNLSLVAISVSTNGVVISNTAPDLFYSNTNYVDDQFVCAISDNFGGTNYQTVSISVVPQTNSTMVLVASPQPGASVLLELQGPSGSTCVLQSAIDPVLGPWEPVATNTLGITGQWRFTDDQVTNYTQRFYRLMLVQ